MQAQEIYIFSIIQDVCSNAIIYFLLKNNFCKISYLIYHFQSFLSEQFKYILLCSTINAKWNVDLPSDLKQAGRFDATFHIFLTAE